MNKKYLLAAGLLALGGWLTVDNARREKVADFVTASYRHLAFKSAPYVGPDCDEFSKPLCWITDPAEKAMLNDISLGHSDSLEETASNLASMNYLMEQARISKQRYLGLDPTTGQPLSLWSRYERLRAARSGAIPEDSPPLPVDAIRYEPIKCEGIYLGTFPILQSGGFEAIASFGFEGAMATTHIMLRKAGEPTVVHLQGRSNPNAVGAHGLSMYLTPTDQGATSIQCFAGGRAYIDFEGKSKSILKLSSHDARHEASIRNWRPPTVESNLSDMSVAAAR